MEAFVVNAKEATIFIDETDGDVWLSIQVHGGSAYTTLTKDKAQELIKALQHIVSLEAA